MSIRLPFEAATTQFIADDPKLVNFRYFFTRKLTFIKESDGFVLLPGGFGTLDEAFELLTLVQTGKAQPAPIVLLDVPGGTYWQTWQEFVERELVDRGYISGDDLRCSCDHRRRRRRGRRGHGFYANYHSLRFVDGRLVLRMQHAPPDERARRAQRRVRRHRRARARSRRSRRSRAEIADDDHLDLERLAFRFDRRNWARLRELIDRLNGRPGSLRAAPRALTSGSCRPAERVDGAFDGAAGLQEPLLVGARRRRRPRGRAQPVVGEVAQPLLDRPQPLDDLLGVSHGSAPRVRPQGARAG